MMARFSAAKVDHGVLILPHFALVTPKKKVARLSISTAKDEVNGIFTMLFLVVLCQGERKHDAKEQ